MQPMLRAVPTPLAEVQSARKRKRVINDDDLLVV